MQYVFITLGMLLIFMLLLLELTGGTLRGLVGFFVEELDENRVPVHPVRLSFRRPAAQKPDPPEEEPPAEHVRHPRREPAQE